MTLETLWILLWKKVGADVTRDKAGVGNDFPQEWNVVGHTWGRIRKMHFKNTDGRVQLILAVRIRVTSDDVVIQGVLHLGERFCSCRSIGNQLHIRRGKKNFQFCSVVVKIMKYFANEDSTAVKLQYTALVIYI